MAASGASASSGGNATADHHHLLLTDTDDDFDDDDDEDDDLVDSKQLIKEMKAEVMYQEKKMAADKRAKSEKFDFITGKHLTFLTTLCVKQSRRSNSQQKNLFYWLEVYGGQ